MGLANRLDAEAQGANRVGHARIAVGLGWTDEDSVELEQLPGFRITKNWQNVPK